MIVLRFHLRAGVRFVNAFPNQQEGQIAELDWLSSFSKYAHCRTFACTANNPQDAFQLRCCSQDPTHHRHIRESTHAFADSSMLASFPIRLASNTCSRFRPRASRDMTVPSGRSTTSAISL